MRQFLFALLVSLFAVPFTSAQPTAKNTKVALLLYPGVELLDFAGPLEVFNHMEGAEFYTVAAQSGPMTIMQKMLTVTPDYTLSTVPQPDILVVPGGRVEEVVKDSDVIHWIQSTTPGRQLTMSVCTGAYLLGKAGLLAGKTVTTHWAATEMLQQMTPKARVMEHTRFVEDGNFLTTAGVSAGIDGALRIVEKLQGRDAARDIARIMEYDCWNPGAGLIVGKPLAAKPKVPSRKSAAKVATPVKVVKTPKNVAAGTLSSTIDPVCKMDVSGERADTIRYMGKVFGFCSKICKERFQRNPAQYTSR